MIEIGIGPNIIDSGSFVLSWHGFLSFVAVIVAVLLTARLAPRHGISTDAVYAVATWGILGGVIGAQARRLEAGGGQGSQLVVGSAGGLFRSDVHSSAPRVGDVAGPGGWRRL